jgi:hypothetical protein
MASTISCNSSGEYGEGGVDWVGGVGGVLSGWFSLFAEVQTLELISEYSSLHIQKKNSNNELDEMNLKSQLYLSSGWSI